MFVYATEACEGLGCGDIFPIDLNSSRIAGVKRGQFSALVIIDAHLFKKFTCTCHKVFWSPFPCVRSAVDWIHCLFGKVRNFNIDTVQAFIDKTAVSLTRKRG